MPPFGDRSEPVTTCPCCNNSRARPLIPQPPIPTKCTRRGLPPRKSISCCLLAILFHQSGQALRRILHRQRVRSARHAGAAVFVVEQLGNDTGQAFATFPMGAAEL